MRSPRSPRRPGGQVRIAATEARGCDRRDARAVRISSLSSPCRSRTWRRRRFARSVKYGCPMSEHPPVGAAVGRSSVREAAAQALATYGGRRGDRGAAVDCIRRSGRGGRVGRARRVGCARLGPRRNGSRCGAGARGSRRQSGAAPRVLPVLTKIPHAAVPALGGDSAAAETSIRVVAVEALGRIARPPASSLLMQALDDPEPDVGSRAIEALSRLGARGVVRRIATARRPASPRTSGASPRSRWRVQEALVPKGNREPRTDGTRNRSASACALLRESDHGTHRPALRRGARGLLAERLASFAIDRGFRWYLDLFYLLKYEDNPADWWQVMDACRCRRPTSGARSIRFARWSAASCRSWSAGARRPLRIWSVPCATGEEPLTIAMAARRGRAGSIASPIEIHASDASPRGDREGARRPLPRARDARAAGGAEGEVLRPRDGDDAGCRLAAPHRVLECRQPDGRRSGGAIRAQSDHLLPQRVHLLLAAAGPAVGRAISPPRMPTPGYLCVGASESLLNITTAFTLRGVDGAFVYAKR